MNLNINIALVIVVVFTIISCASQPLPPPEWVFEKEAIQLHLKADKKLNLDEGIPHTLLVCIYQLKDPNTFNQLTGDIEGIYKLLDCGLYDAGVARAKKLIIHPGQDLMLKIDRSQDAKYVAIVAGYYSLEKDRMTRLFKIPVRIDETGFFKKTKIQKPDQIRIDLTLGELQILK